MLEYIKNNCFTIKGGFNNRCSSKSWWQKQYSITIYDAILDKTSFLDDSCLFSERIYTILHNITETVKCQVCLDKPCGFKGLSMGHHKHCSNYCATQSVDRNLKISRNNDYDNIHEKMKITNLLKYGVPYTTQSDNMKITSKKTKLRRYGNENYNNLDKMKKTNLEKYGVEYTILADSVIQKNKETIISRNPNLWNEQWLLDQNKTKSIADIADSLKVTYRTVYLAFERFNLEPKFFKPTYGQLEKDILDYIRSIGYTGVIKLNDRKAIGPKELDLYFPELNLALEINGIYWHSYDTMPSKNEKNRHLNKLKLCKEKGIRLIQIWDQEWNEKQSIIKDLIKRSLGLNEIIYAKTCRICELDTKEYTKFLDMNHIQGSRNAPIRYGLYHKNKLVSVMSFGKPRFNKKYDIELIRYCTIQGLNIVGGVEKLFKHYIKNEPNKSIISYCDRRLFTGYNYLKLGFIKLDTKEVLDYYWTLNGKILQRHSTQKHKLKNLLFKFDPSLSEDKNMFNNGYSKLFGCGNDVYIYTKK